MPTQQDNPQETKADDLAGLRCPKCDYDLTGLVSPECPECGHLLCIADLRHAQKYSNKPIEAIAKTAFILNLSLFACLILIIFLNVIVDWIDTPNVSGFVQLQQIVSVAVAVIALGLFATGVVSLVTFFVAIMCEDDLSGAYCGLTLLLSLVEMVVFSQLITVS